MSGCLRAVKRGLLPAVGIVALSACFAVDAHAAQDRGLSARLVTTIGASASDAASKFGHSRLDSKGDAALWDWLRAGRQSTGLAPGSGLGNPVSASMQSKHLGALAPGRGEEARLQRKSAPVLWGGYAMAALLVAIAALSAGRGKFASYMDRMAANRRHGMVVAFESADSSQQVMQH